jgi:phenylalanyl-tRNA synthetase beta chain
VKILVSWLRDFVDLTASPEDLGQALTGRGFELSAIDAHRSTIDDDAILDFEVLANRPDALSVVGFARETATIYNLPLKTSELRPLTSSGSTDVAVNLEAPDLCPRYAAAVADVTIGPSPGWLASRLQAAGVRPINNVVDVTNYVLVELGQPMHAFDLGNLGGREIRIRRAEKGERIKTLDGVDRALEPDMLVIADAGRAQAIAGVMGGGSSEVTSATRTIVLESAFFNPKSVRRTSKRVGLKTEASTRFERGTDVGIPVVGLQRAIWLLEAVGAGRGRGGVIDKYPVLVPPKRLALRRTRIPRILGMDVPDRDVERILTSLGFTTQQGEGGWDVAVPTHRVDISREVDLIEEIARHYGYDRLPATFPPLTEPAPPSDPRIERDRLVRRVLLAGGCSEALTFSFVDPGLAAPFADPSAIVPIDNPLSGQFAVMRPSLLPGLVSSIVHNRNREHDDVRLFELGAIVTREGESRRVAAALTGDASGSHWSGSRRTADFFDVKGLVELVASALQVDVAFDAEHLPPYLVPGRAAVIFADRRPAGHVGLLMPQVVSLAGLSANEHVYVAELDLDVLARAASAHTLRVKSLPRYPSIARDISIVVDQILPAATVRGTIRSNAPDTLVSVREFDRYQGKGVPEGRVSLSLRLTFRSPERTLTDAEVQKAMDAVMSALITTHQAVQR